MNEMSGVGSHTPDGGKASRAAKRLLPSPLGPGRILRAMDRLEHTTALDGVIDLIRDKIRAAPLGSLRDVLHGRPLGHPAHPLLVQVPLGSWLSAAVLDLLPGQRRAACVLIGVGLGTAGPAAVAGWVDWAELQQRHRRVGFVHAAANITAVALYAASLTARVRGRARLGRTLGFAGLSTVGIGGAIGGHLAYRQASGANHAEAVQDLVKPGWHGIGTVVDFPVGRAVRRSIDDVPVAVVRESGEQVHVLADMCSHLGGPLSSGEVTDGCVRCPWHGSVFRLSDGWNVRGPATAAQPSFETRIIGGRVEARLRGQEPDGSEGEAAPRD
ncbi:Rieske 2Fe-2S domain-containing protein [Streptomyces sp. NPDC002793]|uniref:Rieske 2Fe-2S domain-containing protein n=1 Tax=Streptomyces sp. NPDC002793 TaxID=3154432 RepID=UPI003316B039